MVISSAAYNTIDNGMGSVFVLVVPDHGVDFVCSWKMGDCIKSSYSRDMMEVFVVAKMFATVILSREAASEFFFRPAGFSENGSLNDVACAQTSTP